MKEEEKKLPVKTKSGLKEITPLRDFVIHCNEFHYDLKKGKSIEVDSRFLPNLKTEKVIK